MYDVADVLIATGSSTSDGVFVTWTASADATVYLEVTLTADAGFDPGNSFDISTSVIGGGPGPGGCVEDAFEDNDDPPSATPLSEGLTAGLQSCDADIDWYAVTLTTGETLDVDVLFEHAEGDLDLEIYDPTAVIVASSMTSTDDESASWTATTNGDHFLAITPVSDTGGLPGNSYEVDVTITAAPTVDCVEDAFEDNDSPVDAAVIAVGSTPALQSCSPADEDWFQITLAVGDTLDVDVFFDNAEGDLDVELLDADANSLAVSDSSTDDESVSWVATAAGAHFFSVVMVSDYGSLPGNTYDLEVASSAVPPSCSDDTMEDNDTPGDAFLIGPSLYGGLVACEGDDDYFQLDVTTLDLVDLSVAFEQFNGNIDVEVLDLAGNVLESSGSETDDEAVSFAPPSDGLYNVRVFLAEDAGPTLGNSYELDVVFTMPCIDDSLEDNDTLATPVAVATTWYPATSCSADDDFYAIDLAAGDSLEVLVEFASADGNIDIALYDPSGVVVASGTSTTDNEELTVVAASTGTYVLEVEMVADVGPDGADYDMFLFAVPAVPPCSPGDFFEPNDTDSAAAEVAELLFTALGACPTDEDWFSIELAAGDDLLVDAFFGSVEGNIDIEIVDPTGAVVASGSNTGDGESASHTAASDGTYLIRVFLESDAGGDPGVAYEIELIIS